MLSSLRKVVLLTMTLFLLCPGLAQHATSTPIVTPMGSEAFNMVKEFFGYDSIKPLDPRIIVREERATCIFEKFVYTTSDGSRIPGLLCFPKIKKTKFPCMILIHSGTGQKEDWWSDKGWVRGQVFVEKLLSEGYAVVAIDAEGHGERSSKVDFRPLTSLAYETKEKNAITKILVQTTIDHLRLIDYLKTKKEIDADGIGVMGYSIGGMISSYLCVLAPKIRVAVLCASGPQFGVVSQAIFPVHFAPRIKEVPVLLIAGKKDALFPLDEVEQFERLFSTNKKLVRYESGHLLPPEYLEDAYQWIRLYLN